MQRETNNTAEVLSTMTITEEDENSSNEEKQETDPGLLQRKLFIGGLSWQTTEDGLKEYFEGLGFAVEKAIIMKDKVSGRSRGFGFITLSKLDDVDKVISTKLHLGRKIEAKRAIPKREMENNARKLFVGGIPINLSNTEFRKYFETFGLVADAQIMTERNSGHSRGFGFVTFEEDEVAKTVLKARHVIQGKTVEVKKAQPKKVENPQPVHLFHPYQLPFFSPYASMYPVPLYGTGFYPPTVSYDSPYLIPQGAFFYAPQYVEPGLQESNRSSTSTPSRKNTYDSPALVRPRQTTSGITYTNPQRQSPLLYVVSPERTERAYSAGPGNYPVSSSNIRKRGMSHPPAVSNTRSKSVSVPSTINAPTFVSSPTQGVTQNRGSLNSKEDRLYKYFQ